MPELKPCPCGKTPERLCITDGSTYRWRMVSGDCCGDWIIEARVHYGADQAAIEKTCREAWNDARRAKAGETK